VGSHLFRPQWILALLATGALVGCDCTNIANVGNGKDGGGTNPDGGQTTNGDSGSPGTDSGTFFYDGGCGPIDAGDPPYPHLCAPHTANECDGTIDAFLTAHGVPSSRLNGSGGNGYDDDCDGEVDEGCTCDMPGQTKDCYLVPATQVDSTGTPLGWCATNSKGTVDCAGEEVTYWSGTCRGAQPPYPHDVCAPGDFNCDGLCCNPDNTGCACPSSVVCPTTTITEAPYPNPAAIALIDGSQWIGDPTQRAASANWTWTVLGGDCDNVLPHPTFAMYDGTNSATATREGIRTPVQFDATASPPRYLATPGAPLISIQYADAGTGVVGGQIYPAFSLSGDYIVQGEFDINGIHYACSQKVAVRAPGIRAELCWDTVGDNDLDIHLARLQGISCSNQGWNDTCTSGTTMEDCYYNDASGCRSGSSSPPGWGYANSAISSCIGWGSERSALGSQGCTNPRLDLDNISCLTADPNPLDIGLFCGPENINLDNPNDGDSFVVGVNFYNGTSAHPHVDLYCNGLRAVSVGYNPATGQTTFPKFLTPGQDTMGDWWNVATVTAHVTGGQLTSCDISTLPSHNPDPTRDGSTNICVESMNNASSPSYSYVNDDFVDHTALQGVPNGSIPTAAAQWCKH
jgi:hypothetical protein